MIEVEDVRRIYQVGDQEVRALAGVSFRIVDGEYVSLMGPSGSGKSTLLHVLGLLDRPTAGRYSIDDRDTTSLDEEAQARVRRERIGFVFQSFHEVVFVLWRNTRVEFVDAQFFGDSWHAACTNSFGDTASDSHLELHLHHKARHSLIVLHIVSVCILELGTSGICVFVNKHTVPRHFHVIAIDERVILVELR